MTHSKVDAMRPWVPCVAAIQAAEEIRLSPIPFDPNTSVAAILQRVEVAIAVVDMALACARRESRYV